MVDDVKGAGGQVDRSARALNEATTVIVEGKPRRGARVASYRGIVATLENPDHSFVFDKEPAEVIVVRQDGTIRDQTRRVECKMLDREKGFLELCHQGPWDGVFPAICSGDYLVPIPCDPALRGLDDWRSGHDRFFGVDRSAGWPSREPKEPDGGPIPPDGPCDSFPYLDDPKSGRDVTEWVRLLRDLGVLEYEAQGIRLVLAPKQIEAPAVTLPKGLELIDIAKVRAAKAEAPPEDLTPEQKHDKLFKSVLPKGAPIPPFAGKK